jgi:hypothetical protein
MTRAADWSEAEFNTLLAHPSLRAEELIALLPIRTLDAVSVVRSGIHDFHRNGTSSLLSQMMIRILSDPTLSWECSECRYLSR